MTRQVKAVGSNGLNTQDGMRPRPASPMAISAQATTLVLKPSPLTPLTVLAFARLMADLVSPGVLNIVSGDDSLGPLDDEPSGFDNQLYRINRDRAAHHGVRHADAQTADAGAGWKHAAIILPDADIDEAARLLVRGSFGNCGQVCLASKQIYAHGDVFEPFRSAFVEHLTAAKVGPGLYRAANISQVNNLNQIGRLQRLLVRYRADGLSFASQERCQKVKTILSSTPPDALYIVQGEQFGPIVPLIRFDEVDEVSTLGKWVSQYRPTDLMAAPQTEAELLQLGKASDNC